MLEIRADSPILCAQESRFSLFHFSFFLRPKKKKKNTLNVYIQMITLVIKNYSIVTTYEECHKLFIFSALRKSYA